MTQLVLLAANAHMRLSVSRHITTIEYIYGADCALVLPMGTRAQQLKLPEGDLPVLLPVLLCAIVASTVYMVITYLQVPFIFVYSCLSATECMTCRLLRNRLAIPFPTRFVACQLHCKPSIVCCIIASKNRLITALFDFDFAWRQPVDRSYRGTQPARHLSSSKRMQFCMHT